MTFSNLIHSKSFRYMQTYQTNRFLQQNKIVKNTADIALNFLYYIQICFFNEFFLWTRKQKKNKNEYVKYSLLHLHTSPTSPFSSGSVYNDPSNKCKNNSKNSNSNWNGDVLIWRRFPKFPKEKLLGIILLKKASSIKVKFISNLVSTVNLKAKHWLPKRK